MFDYLSYARFPTHRTPRLRFRLFNGLSEFLLHAIEVNYVYAIQKFDALKKLAAYLAFAQNASLDIEKGENIHCFGCFCIFRQSFCVFVGGPIRLCVQYESECCDRNIDWLRLDGVVRFAL